MKTIALACLGASLLAAPAFANPSDFPTKPVRLVVPFGSGSLDAVARSLGRQLGGKWKQPVVIENKPGAGGNIGADMVMKAEPDGQTLLFAGPSIAINPVLYSSVPYRLMEDLIPVADVVRIPYVIVVSPQVPARTLKELVDYAKANPGVLNFGSGGVGTASHLAGELLKLRAGIQMVHIPHKGAAATLTELLAGRIHVAVDTVSQYKQYIERGELRALAVPGPSRLPELPNIPTAKEAGVADLEVAAWGSVWAPRGTPPNVVDKIANDIAAATGDPSVRRDWAALGMVPVGTGPAALKTWSLNEANKWSTVIKSANIRAE
ncbi:Bug family tripartite tricarboxylate transporter substrate binding protein [Hydrogenophaga sp. BPS33]|uniref:Bug family tripartite tricarboxylate transporter substrate binding protein n=1 Tax=Hydrogenophaga sp. BPS33 TaxID=2651974 RepID=UPI0013575DAB|nr:tripartite tricarboxylate transporter substrate binding protein [Hydrogenophaga sp. BPS33]